MDWHAWNTALGAFLIARSSASAAAAAICEFARHFDEAFTFTGRH
jgi:fumarylacetoacetate (FAA) hydrolase family protein